MFWPQEEIDSKKPIEIFWRAKGMFICAKGEVVNGYRIYNRGL